MKSKINFLKQKSYNDNTKKITDNSQIKHEISGSKFKMPKRPRGSSRPNIRKSGPVFSNQNQTQSALQRTAAHRKYLKEQCFRTTNMRNLGKKLNDYKSLKRKIL